MATVSSTSGVKEKENEGMDSESETLNLFGSIHNTCLICHDAYKKPTRNSYSHIEPGNKFRKPHKITKPIINQQNEINPYNVGLVCKNTKWIFDCGATDTMTFDANDLEHIHPPRKKSYTNSQWRGN